MALKKAGNSSELVILRTIFKPGFGGPCHTLWNERSEEFLLYANLSVNYMISKEKFIKLRAVGTGPVFRFMAIVGCFSLRTNSSNYPMSGKFGSDCDSC